jgi:hypothetical protein
LPALVLALRDPFMLGTDSSFDWVPLVESTVNDLVFAAIAVFFLWAMPERLERRTARADYQPTAASPERRIMNAEELHHYFDYCSELVSLIAKTAALCAERTSDAVVLHTVSEIETLAAQMSQKIWQKISLLRALIAGPPRG